MRSVKVINQLTKNKLFPTRKCLASSLLLFRLKWASLMTKKTRMRKTREEKSGKTTPNITSITRMRT